MWENSEYVSTLQSLLESMITASELPKKSVQDRKPGAIIIDLNKIKTPTYGAGQRMKN
jgi:hypothetical protein